MSRSRKRHAIITISKAWDKFKERAFRHRVKQTCHEIKFDPDRDWEEAQLNHRKMGEYGTRFGVMAWETPWETGLFGKDWCERAKRK